MARSGGKDRGIVEKPKGSGKWWVRLFVNGREKWYRADNKSQAKAVYGRLKADAREGKYFPDKFAQPKYITLRGWIERCLSGSTNRDVQHERQRARYWSQVFGSYLLSEITTEDLRQHQAKMLRAEEWAPPTVNRYFSALRRMLTLAVKDGRLSRNPMSGVKFLPEPQVERSFTDDELTKLKALMPAEEWMLVVFAVETCLRLSEQFELRWEYVSFDAKTLTIPLSKSNRTRRVPLSDQAMSILRSLGSFVSSPWVFPNQENPLQHTDSYLAAAQFKRVLRRAGIVGASWHTLRHTGASRRLMGGVDIATVSEMLGHSTIHTTMRYVHLVEKHMDDAVNRGSLTGRLGIDCSVELGVKPGVSHQIHAV